MAEYGTLRLMARIDKLLKMVMTKEGVSKEEQDKLVDEAVAERNAMRGMTRTLRLMGEPVPEGEIFPAESAQKINEVASRDLIRHYADGIGDDNPLWRDVNYARNTRWGGRHNDPDDHRSRNNQQANGQDAAQYFLPGQGNAPGVPLVGEFF